MLLQLPLGIRWTQLFFYIMVLLPCYIADDVLWHVPPTLQGCSLAWQPV